MPCYFEHKHARKPDNSFASVVVREVGVVKEEETISRNGLFRQNKFKSEAWTTRVVPIIVFNLDRAFFIETIEGVNWSTSNSGDVYTRSMIV